VDKVQVHIEKQSMLQIKNSLAKLFPTDAKQRRALTNSAKRSAKPIQRALKDLIKAKASKTAKERRRLGYSVGKLRKSIRIFPSKKGMKSGKVGAYVGPMIKVPKSIKKKKGQTEIQRRKAAQEWVKKRSGFYFYMLEYGFGPRGSSQKVGGLGLLPKTADKAGSAALNLFEGEVWKELNKKSMKLFGTSVK